MKELRVAFCFSGQLRTWEHCYTNWQKLTKHFNIKPDVFTHFWDFNTPSQRITLLKPKNTHYNIDTTEINRYLEIYKPKKHKIDNYDTMLSLIDNNEFSINWIYPQFYSLNQSAFLKEQYEIENEFQYDVVIKFRNDTLFTDESLLRIIQACSYISENCPLIVTHVGPPILNSNSSTRIGDMFFMGNSRTFDIVCKFYKLLEYIYIDGFKKEGHPPEYYFSYYINSLNIPHVNLEIMISVLRDVEHQKLLENNNLEPYGIDEFTKPNDI